MKYDCVIIGGGASGLCAAIKVKTKFNKVLLLEHNDRVGKKILSTGNGKCNLTNSFCKTDKFNNNPEGIYPFFTSGNKEFIETVINAYDCDDTIRFFESLGIMVLNKNGYIYPRSEQAASITDCLRFSAENLGVEIITGIDAGLPKYSSSKNTFLVAQKYETDNLIIATGGKSAPKTGSDGSGYKIATAFGHTIIDTLPALCGLKTDCRFNKELSGVRNDSSIRLYNEKGRLISTVSGNLQFTNYGISGIPVFQLSSLAGKMLMQHENPYVEINLLPEYDIEYIKDFLLKKKSDDKELLLGVLNKKLSDVILKNNKSKEKNRKEYINAVAENIKCFKMKLTGTNSFEEAQTTCGGISVDEIDPNTMESKKQKGLYFIGEVVDVNGICGGYNLQWAWSTAHQAAKAISGKTK